MFELFSLQHLIGCKSRHFATLFYNIRCKKRPPTIKKGVIIKIKIYEPKKLKNHLHK